MGTIEQYWELVQTMSEAEAEQYREKLYQRLMELEEEEAAEQNESANSETQEEKD